MHELYRNPLDMSASWTADSARVQAAGEIDLSNAEFLRSYLDFVLDQGEMRVVVDLTNVAFIDSTGLRALVPAAERARSAGGSMVLVGVAPLTATVLSLVPLGRLVSVVEKGVTASA